MPTIAGVGVEVLFPLCRIITLSEYTQNMKVCTLIWAVMTPVLEKLHSFLE